MIDPYHKISGAKAFSPLAPQYLGMDQFSCHCPFTAASLVTFHKRLGKDFLVKTNELFLEDASETPEHADDKPNDNESAVLQVAVEAYYKRNEHYPSRILVNQIYRTRNNRECFFILFSDGDRGMDSYHFIEFDDAM